ncbi:MAG: 6,7-dimethyl-8-ribityllumazine synthase [Hydrogenophilaceae bacterium]|nr:6,7-dimethyl-8-ribityllumazine synthase [Hydrogenophilaceae bacterium]
MARFDNICEHDINLNGQGIRVGIVMSRFNIDICEGLLSACTAELVKLGVKEADMCIATVPGALEIPLALQKLAATDKYDALIALGAVVRGDTYHFEVVSNEMASGIMQVTLDTGLPIANAVLTTDTDDQALLRMSEKGADAARVVVEMVNLFKVV